MPVKAVGCCGWQGSKYRVQPVEGVKEQMTEKQEKMQQVIQTADLHPI